MPPHLFKQMLEASGVAMSIRASDLRPIFANKAFTDFYGYSVEELRLEPLEKIVPKETFTLYTENIRPTVLSGKSWEGEYTIRTKAGRLYSVWGRFDPVLDETGTLTHAISIMRDASASQRLRNALTQTERHLQFLTENTSDCLFRLRLSDGRYDFISSAVKSITGYAPQEFYETPRLFERISPEDWSETFELWWGEFLAGKSRYEYESPIIHRDGSARWVNQRVTVVKDNNGTPIAIEGIITDATGHKRAEEALRANEEKFRFLAENITDVVWTMDNAFNFTYATPSVESMWGYTVEELIALDTRTLFTPEALVTFEHAQRLRAQAEAEGKYHHVNRLEMQHYRKDGVIIWAETAIRRITSKEGKPEGYQGVSRDITERKRTESVIKDSETRFRTLFEDSPISMWEEDLTRLKAYFNELEDRGITNFRQYFYDNPDELGKCATLVDVVAVNRATLDLLRASSQKELLGNLDKVLTESSMAAFTEEMILLASGGCEYCGEITHRTLDGDIIWVVVHFSVPPEYQDTLSRVIVSLLDVTPRKRAEQALMESEERYRILVENAQEGVVVSRGGAALFINEAMSDILGYTTEELKHINPFELIHPNDKTEALQQLREFTSKEHKESFAVFRATRKDKQIRWLTMTTKPILWGGKEAQLEILTDITAHKLLEEKLRDAHAEMEDRVRERTAELSEANIRLIDEAEEREKAQERILSLTQQLIRIQEDERQRIARDLHDNVAQDLSSIVLNMETLFDGHSTIEPVVHERGAAVTDIVRGAIASVRDIAYGLRPPALDQLGLTLALEHFCKDTSSRTGVNIDFFAAGIDNISLDFDAEINIYRMVQEAANNMAKHARATKGIVRLVKSHPDILVRIEDNGQGFEVDRRMAEAAEERRMGLRSMEERARLIGGTMEIQSLVGTGTRIIFKIPLTNARRQ